MSIQLLMQTILNGLMLSSLYVMTATGLTLVLGVLHIINFAHGAFLMLGAYLVWLLVAKDATPSATGSVDFLPDVLQYLHMPYPLAALTAVILIGLLGALVNRFLYQRFWGKVLPCLIVAVGLTQVMQQGAFVVFGIHTKSIPTYFEGVVNIFGARFPVERLVIVAVAVILTAGLLFLLKYTKTGLAMRAVAQDSDAATVLGVSIPRISSIAMFIGCAMAAAAGAVIAPVFTVQAFMSEGYMVKAFMVIILGGMGSVGGAIMAGILVGFIDAFGNVFFGYFNQIILLVMVIVVLIIRPTGLFGGIVFEVFSKDD